MTASRKRAGYSRLTDEEVADIKAAGKMRCRQCNRTKGLHLFYKEKSNRVGYRMICKACHKKNQPLNSIRWNLKRYDLTPEEYMILRGSSKNKCWICGGGSTKNLAVDHNHDDGHVRGLLCQPCNTILGRWNDDPDIVEKALTYLRDNGSVVKNLLGRQPKGESNARQYHKYGQATDV